MNLREVAERLRALAPDVSRFTLRPELDPDDPGRILWHAQAHNPATLPVVLVADEPARLWVWRVCPGRWTWQLIGPHAETLDSGDTVTWPEALAVGLAALEAASVSVAG